MLLRGLLLKCWRLCRSKTADVKSSIERRQLMKQVLCDKNKIERLLTVHGTGSLSLTCCSADGQQETSC